MILIDLTNKIMANLRLEGIGMASSKKIATH